MPAVELTVDQENIKTFAKRFKEIGGDDGKIMRREFLRELKAAAGPILTDIRTAARAVPGVPTEVRTKVAAKTKVTVRLSGPRTGVRISNPRSAAPGFKNAPKSIGSDKGWSHSLFGIDGTVVHQKGRDYFDGPIATHRADAKAAVERAINTVKDLLAARS